MDSAYTVVANALINAEDGGYGEKIAKMTDEQLTDDLRDCDADCARYTRQQVLDAVKVYRLPY